MRAVEAVGFGQAFRWSHHTGSSPARARLVVMRGGDEMAKAVPQCLRRHVLPAWTQGGRGGCKKGAGGGSARHGVDIRTLGMVLCGGYR